MKTQGLLLAVVALMVAITMTTTVTAQEVRLEKAVISAGGGEASNFSTNLNLTVGQPVVGITSSSTYIAMLGFWNTALQQASSVPVLPGEEQVAMTVAPHPVSGEGSEVTLNVARSGKVKVMLYDALGNEVKTLLKREHSGGEIHLNIDGRSLPSGTYYIAVTAPGVLLQRPISVVN